MHRPKIHRSRSLQLDCALIHTSKPAITGFLRCSVILHLIYINFTGSHTFHHFASIESSPVAFSSHIVNKTTMSSLPKSTTGRGRPANVYYFRRISFYWVGLAIFAGAFLCSGLDSASDASQATIIVAWSTYAVMLAVIMATEPTAVVSVGRIDESGEAIRLYRPFVGWKSTEMIVGLDELPQGNFDRDHGTEDERFRDVSNLALMSLTCGLT